MSTVLRPRDERVRKELVTNLRDEVLQVVGLDSRRLAPTYTSSEPRPQGQAPRAQFPEPRGHGRSRAEIHDTEN